MGDNNGIDVHFPMPDRPTSIPPAIYPHASSTIPTEIESIRAVANCWILSLNRVLANNDLNAFGNLFHEESYWRDHLCLSFDFHTFHGPRNMGSFIRSHSKCSRLRRIAIDESDEYHMPAVKPLDAKGEILGIRSFLKVETDIGVGKGLVTLSKDPANGSWKAFTLYTCLQELKGYKETIKYNRPLGTEYLRNSELCEKSGAMESYVSPAVLIVGKYLSVSVSHILSLETNGERCRCRPSRFGNCGKTPATRSFNSYHRQQQTSGRQLAESLFWAYST
jgi:hypothetical protein